jgi:hypothetical protein
MWNIAIRNTNKGVCMTKLKVLIVLEKKINESVYSWLIMKCYESNKIGNT